MADQEKYGCPGCWPESAEAAWEAGSLLERRHELIRESHFNVRIVGCHACGQAFLWVFSELIDWSAGDDSQGWIRIPLTVDEVRNLRGLPEDDVERTIYGIGENRRSLRRIHPRGMTAGCSWDWGFQRYRTTSGGGHSQSDVGVT